MAALQVGGALLAAGRYGTALRILQRQGRGRGGDAQVEKLQCMPVLQHVMGNGCREHMCPALAQPSEAAASSFAHLHSKQPPERLVGKGNDPLRLAKPHGSLQAAL